MKVTKVEFVLTNYEVFRIEEDNILECIFMTKYENIDIAYDSYGSTSLNMLENLLLVVKDYTKIYEIDHLTSFNPERRDIAQIRFYTESDENEDGRRYTGITDAYVNLTNPSFNATQINTLDGNRLYITIDEKL